MLLSLHLHLKHGAQGQGGPSSSSSSSFSSSSSSSSSSEDDDVKGAIRCDGRMLGNVNEPENCHPHRLGLNQCSSLCCLHRNRFDRFYSGLHRNRVGGLWKRFGVGRHRLSRLGYLGRGGNSLGDWRFWYWWWWWFNNLWCFGYWWWRRWRWWRWRRWWRYVWLLDGRWCIDNWYLCILVVVCNEASSVLHTLRTRRCSETSWTLAAAAAVTSKRMDSQRSRIRPTACIISLFQGILQEVDSKILGDAADS